MSPPPVAKARASEKRRSQRMPRLSCAAIKPGTSIGRMPEKVFVAARASVTAGFANDVEEVNQ